MNLLDILNMEPLMDTTNKKATNYNIILFVFKKYKEQPDNLKLLTAIRRIITNIKKDKQSFKSVNTNLIRTTLPNYLNLTTEEGKKIEEEFNNFVETLEDDDSDRVVLDNFILSVK